MTEGEAIKKLKTMISENRLKHSLGVRDTAIKLAQEYGASEKKAKWAGLLHDCAKGISNKHLLKKAGDFAIVIDTIYKKIPTLLHAPIGAQLAKREFNISDQDILTAISLHTLGSAEMTVLDKVVFLADYIEPNRSCQAIADLRARIKGKPLDEAVKLACENTIRYNLEQGRIIHPQTIITRNSVLGG